MKMPKVLLIDDETAFADNVTRLLQLRGYEASFAGNGEEGLKALGHPIQLELGSNSGRVWRSSMCIHQALENQLNSYSRSAGTRQGMHVRQIMQRNQAAGFVPVMTCARVNEPSRKSSYHTSPAL